jgi:hypothetical protein
MHHEHLMYTDNQMMKSLAIQWKSSSTRSYL